MKEDKLLDWWLRLRFDSFCTYMHAWHKPFNNVPESHEDESIRIDRAISYVDQNDDKVGFITHYLLIKYHIDFVEYITDAYWKNETERVQS